jgi:hypothetical protein
VIYTQGTGPPSPDRPNQWNNKAYLIIAAPAEMRTLGGTFPVLPACRSRGRLIVVSALKSRPARTKQALLVEVEPDGSDSWRLDPVVERIKAGEVR